jgi:hypothetical protein
MRIDKFKLASVMRGQLPPGRGQLIMTRSGKLQDDASIEQFWLNVPQAVYLEATHDIEGAKKIAHENPKVLMLKAALRLGWVYVPDRDDLGPKAAKELALRELGSERGRYEALLARLHDKLIGGLPVKGRRQTGLPLELVDPAEFTGLRLYLTDAVNPTTGETVWFDLRISAQAQLEGLAKEHQYEPWDSGGDPLPRLVAWALSLCDGDASKLPGRDELLQLFRLKHGPIRGVSQRTMREVRRRLVPEPAKKGGSLMHRR